MSRAGKFDRRENRGTKRCKACRALRQEANIDPSTGLCQDGMYSCLELAGQQNAHSDLEGSERDHAQHPQAGCPDCHPELEALFTPEGRAAWKAQGGGR